ncbi:MAG: hypothetical protein ABDH37_01940 [Candidatus Hydrothermales bacterium]
MAKYKFLLFLLLLIFGTPFILFFTYFQGNNTINVENLKFFLTNNYGNTLSIFTRNLVDPILLNEKQTISEIISDLSKIEGIVYVAVADKDGNLIASSNIEDEGKKVGEIFGREVNIDHNSQLETNDNLGIFYLITPVKLKTGDLEKVVGGVLIGLSSQLIRDIFFAGKLSDTIIILLFMLILSALFVFMLAQVLIFSPISKKIKNYELREKKYVTYENLKRAEDEIKVSISKLEEKKKNLEVEIEEVSKKLEIKRREIEESDLGKIVKELEERKIMLENEIEQLKREEEEVKAKLVKDKMEQEELKKRLDVIRQKMKQIMGP